jgi:hypothetical protein
MSQIINTIKSTNFNSHVNTNPEFINQIKKLIIKKKLDKFKLINFDTQIECPILKPTLNTREIDYIMAEINPGELRLARIQECLKIMIYLDHNNTGWEVCVLNNNNHIIDIEFCGNKFQSEPEPIEKTRRFNEIVQSIDTTYKNINVLNDTYLPEFKMIIYAIISQEISQELNINDFIESHIIYDTINTLNMVGFWKVIYVESKREDCYVFMVKDEKNKFWIVVSEKTLTKITNLFWINN